MGVVVAATVVKAFLTTAAAFIEGFFPTGVSTPSP